MRERDVGSALVADYGRLIGILTSRDMLRVLAGRVHSSEARVRAVDDCRADHRLSHDDARGGRAPDDASTRSTTSSRRGRTAGRDGRHAGRCARLRRVAGGIGLGPSSLDTAKSVCALSMSGGAPSGAAAVRARADTPARERPTSRCRAILDGPTPRAVEWPASPWLARVLDGCVALFASIGTWAVAKYAFGRAREK